MLIWELLGLGMLSSTLRVRAEAGDLQGIASAATADPNWLLSTILQACVAMVAVLATLWLWRAQERSRAAQRYQRAQEDLAAASQAFAQVNEAIERNAVTSWLVRAMDQLVRTPDASIEYLVSRCGFWGYETSSLATAVGQASVYVRNARAEIADASRNRPLAGNWDEFRVEYGIPLTCPLQEMVYERVYLKLMVEQRADAVLPAARPWPISASVVADERFDESPGPVAHPGVRAEPGLDEDAEMPPPRHSLVVTSAEGQHLETERARIVQRMLRAATAVDSARAEVDQATRGWSTKWYLLVTGYATLIGIVLPGVVLTLGPTTLNPALRWLLFSAFCTVVLAVVSTFAITIRLRGRTVLSSRRPARSGTDRDADPARAGADADAR